jgi:hypothetical protein
MRPAAFKFEQWLEITQYLHKRLVLRGELENFPYHLFPISNLYKHSTEELISMVKYNNEQIMHLQQQQFLKQQVEKVSTRLYNI